MSIARSIAPHLPYLRRFARALEGAQAGGDAFVAATLEALIADPSSFPTDVAPKVGLYRVFVKLWSSTHRGRAAVARRRARRRLAAQSRSVAAVVAPGVPVAHGRGFFA